MHQTAAYWIEKLGLLPHPEGGHYVRTYCAGESISRTCLPNRFTGDRPHSTAIYYLLSGREFSAFHRIKSDEIWHHYAGSALTLYSIAPDGMLSARTLGKNAGEGESFQVVVRAGCWFGAGLQEEDAYALVGCTVSPGFDLEDFEMARRDVLLEEFPEHEWIIRRLTR